MRIARQAYAEDRERQLAAEIAAAAHGRGVEGRVCGANCTLSCQHCGSRGCQCPCSPYCTDAPRALSSDPAFPIERGIAPLVFEMKRSGLFEPCWSCEGHANGDGSVQKPPTVWFYCGAMAHVRLLADGLGKLKSAGRLGAPWRIVVTFSDPDNPATTFALEPADHGAQLQALQRDADEIARALPGIMREQARALSEAARRAALGM